MFKTLEEAQAFIGERNIIAVLQLVTRWSQRRRASDGYK